MLVKKLGGFLLIIFLSLGLIGIISISTEVQAQEEDFDLLEATDLLAIIDGDEVYIQDIDDFLRTDELIMTLFQVDQEFTQVLIQSEAGQDLMNEYRKSRFPDFLTYYLLQREIERKGIELTAEKQEEIFQEHLELILAQSQSTEEEFVTMLQQQGIQSIEEYQQFFQEVNEEDMMIYLLQEELFAEITFSEEELEEYYQENKDFFFQQAGVEVSHILVEEKELAEELQARAKDGEDFAKLAEEYSIDPGAEQGKLGLVTEETQFVEPFKAEALALSAGEISAVVETQFGFHIIKAHEIVEEGLLEFNEVRDEVEILAMEEKRSSFWDEYRQELEDEVEVELKL